MKAEKVQKILDEIHTTLKNQGKLEFVYKNFGIKFKKVGDALFTSHITHVGLRWTEFEDVDKMSIVGLAKTNNHLNMIIKKINKAKVKEIKKQNKSEK